MSPIRLLLLAIFSGVLLAFSWPEIGLLPLIFFAWLPLFFIEDYFRNAPVKMAALKLYGLSYLTFLIWNVGSTWWIKNASFEGALLAFLANSALMAGVFTLAFQLRKRLPSNRSWIYLPILWIAFEYIHHDWDLSWPWLSLGNAMASMPELVQWYEFTGIAGGSIWILLINILFYKALRRKITQPETPILMGLRFPLLVFLIPSLLSLLQYSTYEEKSDSSIKVAIVQPNIDPYGMKFNSSTLDAQLESFLQLAKGVTDSSTNWLFGPETALVGSMDEAHLAEYPRIIRLQEFMQSYPKLNILIGAETHQFYMKGEEMPYTARQTRDPEVFYDSYNTALLLSGKRIEVYHKSKLVPGVEQMPFPWIFKHIESLAIDLGGTTGTLGRQDERTVFVGRDSLQKVVASICYESVYGDFMQNYIRGGANFIAIITNDGWWGDTPGYRQHLAYARLRAIESRRDVIRSANTGISAIINQRGDIIEQRAYWTPAAIAGELNLNNELTIYSLTGDFLGLSALILSVFLLLFSLLKNFKARIKKNKV
ncbi:MAG: apolipoprotein N-acyltransferase [Bacteroidia bacterium]